MDDFTKEELSALRAVRRALGRVPKNIKLYTTDGELTACKVGLSCDEVSFDLLSRGVNIGAVLSNIHDAKNLGEDATAIKV